MHVFYQYLVIYMLTPILQNTITLTFANSVDPDQMTYKDATWSVSHYLPFTLQIQMNTLFQSFQLVDSHKWVCQVSLINRSIVNVFI